MISFRNSVGFKLRGSKIRPPDGGSHAAAGSTAGAAGALPHSRGVATAAPESERYGVISKTVPFPPLPPKPVVP
jgi:hypothetical protein